jgi:SAM dependent carboxyl methyltransferase
LGGRTEPGCDAVDGIDDMTGATGGMKGDGYYDANSSFQAKVAASASALLEQAVAALEVPAGAPLTVADYGSSEGRNSIATVGRALALLAARGPADAVVLHNDLPTNDWRGLAGSLAGPDSYLHAFPGARALFAPRSFFERVTAPASVTLGTSGSSAHWLSHQPSGLDMPRSLYRSDAPPDQCPKILAQAASDWEAFLTARAEELQPGGVLLVQMLGADGTADPVRVSAAGLLALMNTCALALVDAGEIPADVYAGYCFPVVPRTLAEAAAPLAGGLDERLELLHCGLTAVASPYQAALERTGNVAAFARDYTAFTRAFSESTLTEGLFRFARSGADGAASKFYAMMETALAERPQAYPFDDLTLAVMVRRRA